MDSSYLGNTGQSKTLEQMFPCVTPPPPKVNLPLNIASLKGLKGHNQVECLYRHLDGEERILMDWFNGAIAIWTACMLERKAWMKEHPPAADKNGKSKKPWYPRVFNPFQFKPVTQHGNHECKLMFQKKKNGRSTDMPIAKSSLTTRKDGFDKKIVKYATELMAIVLALDVACCPIRRLDRRIRILKHENLFIDKDLAKHNGISMPAKTPRTGQLANPNAIATQLPNIEAADHSDEPVVDKRDRRVSRQREF
jgi:hypothetical protein